MEKDIIYIEIEFKIIKGWGKKKDYSDNDNYYLKANI